MTRFDIVRTNYLNSKSYWKEYRNTFIKKYLKFLSYVGLALIGVIAFMHRWVGAANQNYNRLEYIRKNDPFYVKSN